MEDKFYERYLIKNYDYRYDIRPNGYIYDKIKERYVSVTYDGKSKTYYPVIRLVDKEGIEYNLVIHKLLAVNFIDGYKPGMEVNHKDGDKGNFNLDNLEWVTPSENTQHAMDNNLIKNMYRYKSKTNKNEVLSEEDKEEIIHAIMRGESNYNLAKKYKLNHRFISEIRRRNKYAYLWDNLYPNIAAPRSSTAGVSLTKDQIKYKNGYDECVKILEELRTNKAVIVASKYDLHPSILSRAKFGKTWELPHEEHKKLWLIPLPVLPILEVDIPDHYNYGNKNKLAELLGYEIAAYLNKGDKLTIEERNRVNVLFFRWVYLYYGKIVDKLELEYINNFKQLYNL